LAGFARWCFRHRKIVLGIWVIALIGFALIGQSAKAVYSNSFSLPGTDSSRALAALKADFPARAGDSEQIVVQAKAGTLRSSAAKNAVTSMLTRVSRLPHVSSVSSPYGPGGEISRDGTIGLAAVSLDKQAQDVPKAAVTRLISTAQSGDKSLLNVQLSGMAIENHQSSGGNTSLLLGIVFALGVLFFAFRRSLLGALLPLISALLAIGVGTSILNLLSHTIAIAAFAPQVAILVALGVGVDYALFIASRYRSGLLAGQSAEEAAIVALNTSGRAVLLAGLTVCVALLGLFVLQVSFLYGVAVSIALVVALTMLASLTLLPAMLGFFGPRVLRRGERRKLAQQGRQVEQAGGFWLRCGETISGRPAVFALLAVAVIGVLAAPFFSMRLGLLDASTDPPASTTHRAYELLAKGFGPGFNGPLEIVGQVASPADRAHFASFVTSLQHQPGVVGVEPPRVSPNGKAEVAVVYPATGPQQAQTADVLQRVRAGIPRAEAGTGLVIHVGGDAALSQDFSQVLNNKMPQFVAVVVGLAFLLLAIVFRSLLIPLVASIMNLLSFGVALGVMTAAFQFGWGKAVLGFAQPGPIESYIPVMMFAILFGLSTDYEVFLVSRMHEEWALTGDNKRAVVRAQAETGRVITAASLIMILVFASFIFGGLEDIKQLGLGFAAAIILDAYIIRTLLVPAVMHLLGRANWWIPAWLDRVLPHMHMEPTNALGIEMPRPPTAVEPHRQ
jgi:putative drug exporter of the RND superfamily